MKKLLLILLLFCSYSYGQVTTKKLVSVFHSTDVFNDNLSAGNKIIDQSTYREYLILRSLVGTKSISTCVLGLDIIETGGIYFKYKNDSIIGSGYATNYKLSTLLSGKVDKATTINGYSLNSNITLTKGDISLGSVDNTSDLNKPISTATQTALNSKQNLIGYTPYNATNPAGYISTETDPNIYSWARQNTKPSYTASEVGLGNVTNNAQWYSGNHPTTTSAYGLPDYPTTLPASDVYSWAKASTKPSYSFSELTSHPTTLADYGITDTPWTSYLPLTGGTVTGTTSFAAGTYNAVNMLDLVGTSGEAGLTVWTLNSDAQSDYGTNIIGNLGANRKILRVGENLGSNGFTVDWIHSTSRFVFLFSQGDVTVDGKVRLTDGLPTEYLMADGSRTTSTTPITLTTTGSGASTLVGSNLNIPTPPTVESGSYTPTLTNYSGITSSSLICAYYTRNGNIVHVAISGSVISSTTSGSTMKIGLPVSSTTIYFIGSGLLKTSSGGNFPNGIVANGGSNTASFSFTTPVSGDNYNFDINFDYIIQ